MFGIGKIISAINSFVDQTLTRFHDTTDACQAP